MGETNDQERLTLDAHSLPASGNQSRSACVSIHLAYRQEGVLLQFNSLRDVVLQELTDAAADGTSATRRAAPQLQASQFSYGCAVGLCVVDPRLRAREATRNDLSSFLIFNSGNT